MEDINRFIPPESPEALLQVARSLHERMQKEGITLQEALGLNPSLLEEVYALAHAYYSQGDYKKSINLFQFLASLSPKNPTYNLGLGASLHQVEDYESASLAFFAAFSLDPSNPLPCYYTADCFLKLGLREEAEEFLDLTIETIGDHPEHQELKNRCELIKHSLKK